MVGHKSNKGSAIETAMYIRTEMEYTGLICM